MPLFAKAMTLLKIVSSSTSVMPGSCVTGENCEGGLLNFEVVADHTSSSQIDYWVIDGWRFRLLDLRQTLADIESGDDHGLNAAMIRDLKTRLQRLEEIMGPELVYSEEERE